MTPLSHKLIKLFTILAGILVFSHSPAFALQIRPAVYAGKFYPQNPEELISQIAAYTELAAQTPVSIPDGAVLKALILPHAGYIYSGSTAANCAKVLKGSNLKKIIIMGPDHRIGFKNCVISDVAAYQTPLGNILLHPDSISLRQQNKDIFRALPKSNDIEHSIEVQIPFLQYHLTDFRIVPVIMGPGDTIAYSEAIARICDSETLIVASSDLSHYLPYNAAVNADRETIDKILALNIEWLSDQKHRACGIIPIQVLTKLAIRNNWQPVLLHYANSGDTAGPKDSVVGYAAIAYFQTSTTNLRKGSISMDKEKGDILLKLARNTIKESLLPESTDSKEINSRLSDDIFKTRRGTFVTLKINNRLRGCIGNLSGDKPIIDGIRDNAINAAFHDPRFPPLSANELNKVDIEISLLTEPEVLEYQDGDDLLEKLRPDIDGVIIRKGPYSATFLPQVWEQLPDKKSFLEHLCQKAGLPSDAWRRPGLEVMVYQVQYFEENH